MMPTTELKTKLDMALGARLIAACDVIEWLQEYSLCSNAVSVDEFLRSKEISFLTSDGHVPTVSTPGAHRHEDNPDPTSNLGSPPATDASTCQEDETKNDGPKSSRKALGLDGSVTKSRYRWRSEVARGGLGAVWLAEDCNLNRRVAAKELLPGVAGSRRMHDRFLGEARITGQLDHPNIVPVYDLGVKEDGQPFYTMKFLEGDTLSVVIADYHALATNDPSRTKQLHALLEHLIDVCEAIAFAHGRHIIHRDLKPHNVIIGGFGETIVVDWGLARSITETEEGTVNLRNPSPETAPISVGSQDGLRSSGSSSCTRAGDVMGTPAYLSPEQASGRLDLDGRTDIYSLGVMLYEILVGQTPFQCSDTVEILKLMREGACDDPSSVDPRVPPALNAICVKAMSHRREDRYETAQQLADDIR